MILIVSLLGCNNPNTIYENEFFQYKILRPEPKFEHIMIIGLTDLGKEQTNLIIPSEIDGIPVLKLGKEGELMFGVSEGRFDSDNLVKVYNGPTLMQCNRAIFIGCTRLETILFNNSQLQYYVDINRYDPDIPIQPRIYIPRNNALPEFTLKVQIEDMFRIANVSYYWNYIDAPEEGSYFIDWVDGTIIDFIPPDPQREGFVFSGWFTEAECINEWDFENDIVMGPLFNKEGVSPYFETALFAKWEKD